MKHLLPYWQDSKVHNKVWALAWPMIVSNITNPLLGLVDTAVMGHLDSPVFMGAVAVGSVIVGFLIWACNFLRMGATGFASQAFGRKDNPEIHAIIWRSVIAAQIIAIVLISLQTLYADAAFYFINGSEKVNELALTYFQIRVWGLPASIASFAIIGWFLGVHNTRVPLILLVITNGLNIVLDIIFVLVLGWNVEGAALASLVSEYTNLILGLYFVIKELKQYPAPTTKSSIFSLSAIVTMFSVNRDIFLRTMALQIVFFMIAAQGAKLGDHIIAANAVLLNFLFLITNGLDGLAQAIEALVGKAIGAKDRYGFKVAIIVASGWSLLMSLAYLISFAIFGDLIIGLLTNIESVKSTALEYLPWLIIMPLNGVWSYILDGIFIGATKAKEMRDSMIIATFLGFFPALWLLQPYGNHGIWFAFHIFMIVRTLVLGVVFWRMYRKSEFIPETFI